MRKLKPYHLAWLDDHPRRTEEWLRNAMREGFDIHHVDGDHENNDPSNLVLIECQDHMRFHGAGSATLRRLFNRGRSWGEDAEVDHTIGEQAYNLRKWGLSWRKAADALGMNNSAAFYRAKTFAAAHNVKWPVGVKQTHVAPKPKEIDLRFLTGII